MGNGESQGNPSLPMGPGRPRAEIPRLRKALRDNMSQGGSASFLIPPQSESRMKNKNSLTITIHQDLALQFKR